MTEEDREREYTDAWELSAADRAASEADEAYEIHAANARARHSDARDALMNAIAQLTDAQRWLAEASEQDCGGDCCLINTRHIDSLLDDAVRNIFAAHAMARATDDRS